MSANERTNTLTGTWKEGQIILDEAADWPEGCRVSVEPILGEVEAIGITEEQWPRTPESIAEWLAWFDSIEPIEMTPEEEAEWQAALAAQKAYEIAKFDTDLSAVPGLSVENWAS
jgi:hypothetical protein